jgi:hypothetical protein
MRLVHKLNKAFGEALTLRGAAKKSKLTGLAKLIDGKISGYTVPARAQEALDKYEQKKVSE